MDTVRGLGIVLVLTLVAGLIAYVGDRVGHQVGRKRLTLFGMRPKYTSTIVAVATGMLIALTATLVAIAFSEQAKTAFFHINELNARVNELQARAEALDRHARTTHLVLNSGDLVFPVPLLITQQQSPPERLRALSRYFDATVDYANRVYRRLKPFPDRSTAPEVQQKLRSYANTTLPALLSQSPVLLLAATDENLFENDPIHFEFRPFPDHLIFRAKDPIVSMDVQGGPATNLRFAINQLGAAVANAALSRGMPSYFASSELLNLTAAEYAAMSDALRRTKTPFTLTARADTDTYPHSGGIIVDVSLTPK